MFDGSLILCRHIIKKDKIGFILWAAGILSITFLFAMILPNMYPTSEERAIMAEVLKNPAMVAMLGKVYDSLGYTLGAMYSNFMLVWMAATMGIMNIFLIVKNTRQDEEAGRTEVVRSLAVGRLSTLNAALIIATALNVLLGIITALGLMILNVESMNAGGCILYGATLAASGIVFAAITAVVCQVFSSSSSALAVAFAVLGGSYFLRAVGDINAEALSWFSPLGIILRGEVFCRNLWFPFVLTIILSMVFAALSFYLCSIRDMGAGLIKSKNGRAGAKKYLNNVYALALKLCKTSCIIWIVTIFVVAAAYGSVMGDIDSFLSTNEVIQKMFPSSEPKDFLFALMKVMAILMTIPIMQLMLKINGQEKSAMSDCVLATPTSRHSYLLSYFILAFSMTIIMPLTTALGFYLGSYSVLNAPLGLGVFLESAILFAPALMVMLGMSSLLFALRPRFAWVAWAYLGASFLFFYIGSLMDFPSFTNKLFPYGFISDPNSSGNAISIPLLVLVAFALYALSFYGYKNREIKA